MIEVYALSHVGKKRSKNQDSRSTYIYYETGKSKPGFATLRKNSAIFAVDYKR